MTYLQGKVVWVTGASSGIGRGVAIELVRRGAKVALTSRSSAELQALQLEISNLGGESLVCVADVTNQENLLSAVEKIRNSFGPIDVVVANAGTHIESHPEIEFKTDDYLKLMDINFGGMLRTFGAVVPEMLKQNKGHLVGVASLAGYRGLPRAAAYGASKAAMIHFLESARHHLEKKNIAVTIVCPGFVRTPLTDKNTFDMPFITDVQKAAKIICDGIERKADCVTFPFPFNWIISLVRLLPAFLFKPLARFVDKRAQT